MAMQTLWLRTIQCRRNATGSASTALAGGGSAGREAAQALPATGHWPDSPSCP
ncbi:uncharacterized protein TrAFT101_003537 [Trichoderma asperellum]|uniref:uncharacterized protein n=1 Tax=Trichoderma asperellum TaxID=101201 RepID=UPI00331FD158|nr:hypothetical protein TrAFT101_003537 [Trichoderma asperellum]